MATNTSNVINMRSSTSSPSFAYSGAYVGCLFTDNTTNNYHQDPRLALAAGNLQVQPMLNTKMLISPSPSPRLPQGSAASSWANNTIEYCAPLLGEDVQSMEAAGLPAPSLLRCSSQFLLVDEEDEEDELLQALGSFVSGDPSGPSSMFSSVASRASDHSLYCLSVIDDASGLTREATPEEAWKVNELLIKERHEVHMERAEAAAKAATAHGRRRPPTVPSAIPRQQQLPLPKSSSHHEEGGDSIPTSQHFHQAPPASASFTMPAGTFLPPPSSFIDKSVMMMSIQEEEGGGGDAAARDSASGLLHRRGGPCNHCGATESPQWRRGPPKTPTLCNACGMRFRRTNQLNLPPPPPPPMPSDAAAKAAQRMKNNSSYSPITLCQDEVLPETYSIAEAPLQEQGVVLMASATSVGPRVTKRVPKADAPLHLAELTCGDAAQESPAAYKRVKRAAAVGVAQLTAALAAS